MKSYFDQNYYLKERFLDSKRTKNHPKNCQMAHSFCNLEYEWADSTQKQPLPSPINPLIPNVQLPKNKDKQLSTNHQSITEQDLDDWVAQSLNRNMKSLLNPQKKFNIPQQFQEQLKNRYKKKQFSNMDQDMYFQNKKTNKTKSFHFNRKNRIQVSQLYFDYNKLEPKHVGGMPIRIRQFKNKKIQIIRRNAIYLNNDLSYVRFMKQLSKLKEKSPQKKQQKLFLTQTDSMFYSFNLQSLNRKSGKQQTPSSIGEKQFKRFQQLPKDYLGAHKNMVFQQQKVNQNFREKVVQKTNTTQKYIKDRINSNLNTNATKIIPTSDRKQLFKINQNDKQKFHSVRHKTSTNSLNIIDTKSIAKDKILQSKVISLLNDMQIISEQIDFQMSQLNIHLTQITLKTIDSRPQTRWAIKAQQKLLEGNIQLAIDCYKQALIIQPQFFVPIFNISVLLEKQKMYFQARKWFQVCKQFQIDEQNVNFGLALVDLKQNKFQECFKIIDDLIKKDQKQNKELKISYYYVRALCLKKMKHYDLSKTDFSIVIKKCKPINYDYFSQFLIGMIFSKTRRLNLKFNCLSYMNFLETYQQIECKNGQKICDLSQNDIKNIANKLIDKSFFKRFSISLIEKLLIKTKIQTIKSQSLIFINQQQTAIVLSGFIACLNHLQIISRPKTISLIQQGGIIGAGKMDNNLNEKSNNWFLTKTDVQIIKIQRKFFNEFWRGQITFDFDFKYNFIKNVSLFKKLPEATLFNICEKIQKITFSYGTILFNDCSYRNNVINKNGTGFGLGKLKAQTDTRFLNSKKITNENRKKGKYRLAEFLKKHYFKINQLKFNKLKYPGIFIVLKGKIQVQDDCGFRCQDLTNQRQYFGENLIMQSDGYQNYGRMVVASKQAQLYFLSLEKLIWLFTSEDKKVMKQNSKNRSGIQTIRFLRARFKECKQTRINYHNLLNKNNI